MHQRVLSSLQSKKSMGNMLCLCSPAWFFFLQELFMFHKSRSLSDYYHYYRCYYHYHYCHCHCHCRYTTASLSKLVSQGQQTQWWSAPNLNIIILPRPTTSTSHARHLSATKRFLHSSETINRDQQRYSFNFICSWLLLQGENTRKELQTDQIPMPVPTRDKRKGRAKSKSK